MNIQAPPNLQPEGLAQLVRAGINDWGGVSPVTPDHVNPEAPWPQLRRLAARDRSAPAARWSSGWPSIRSTHLSSRNFAAAKYPGPRAPAQCSRWVPALRAVALRPG